MKRQVKPSKPKAPKLNAYTFSAGSVLQSISADCWKIDDKRLVFLVGEKVVAAYNAWDWVRG